MIFWTILKYYKPVLRQNTTYRSCYYLFIGRNLPVMHRRPLFITVEKTNTGFCIPNNLFTSMKKKKRTNSFLQNHYQHHCLSSPDSHKSSGLLFDKLESQFGYAAWANYTHYCKFRQRIKSDIHPVLLSFIFENVTVKTLVSAQDLQTFINMFV